ncbi:MAG: ferritin-like domain-containing protein [Deltaproteobacteria bacterium]|nr:ferritin-like domain-containing protein [Deltaproteobacteria bacterium]MBW2361219.1 ferritin-like domain-containing protein [Deltaproteobacteria bacterium]
MGDFLAAYSIQNWLESCPQGYLEGTLYGHTPGDEEPEFVLENPVILESSLRTTVQLVAGERCALAASSGLINAAPDFPSKRFLATQTLDEARHVEIFTQRLYDLGVKKDALEDTIAEYASPHLIEFAEVLLEKVDKGDFVAGVVGQNIVLEGMAFSVFELLHASVSASNPKFAATLAGTIADERRHVGFGENRIGSLIREFPEKKAAVQGMQREMSHHMLQTFTELFSRSAAAVREGNRLTQEAADAGEDISRADYNGTDLNGMEADAIEGVLANTVIGEFKTRLGRIGLEYQTPS